MEKGKRARTKHPALRPELNLKTRYELIDYDYVWKLSEEEKEWLNKFTEEYVNAHLDRKELTNNLHNTKELKQDCDRRNNARNADILTKCKAAGKYISFDELLLNKKTILTGTEDELLEVVDNFVEDPQETSD
jgi:hypothetical protein